jgi:hypothetical protein
MDKLKNYLCMAIEAIGFESPNDFFTSVFALKHKVVTFYSYGFAFGMIMTMIKFISHNTAMYIYSPPAGIVILFGVSSFDFLLGLSNSITNTNIGIKAGRISRTIIRFVVQVIFVAILFNMNLVWPIFIQSWMVDTLLFVFVISTLWSAFQNARDLSWVTQEQFEMVESFISIKNLIPNFIKKKKENNGDPNVN